MRATQFASGQIERADEIDESAKSGRPIATTRIIEKRPRKRLPPWFPCRLQNTRVQIRTRTDRVRDHVLFASLVVADSGIAPRCQHVDELLWAMISRRTSAQAARKGATMQDNTRRAALAGMATGACRCAGPKICSAHPVQFRLAPTPDQADRPGERRLRLARQAMRPMHARRPARHETPGKIRSPEDFLWRQPLIEPRFVTCSSKIVWTSGCPWYVSVRGLPCSSAEMNAPGVKYVHSQFAARCCRQPGHRRVPSTHHRRLRSSMARSE